MNIEEVAEKDPTKIHREFIDIETGVTEEQLSNIANALGFNDDSTHEQTVNVVRSLYDLFVKTDATLVEINPLGETADGYSEFYSKLF